ncbi:MAG TPA: TRAP transporter substrate-binding protein [Dongiaceae bacterium]|jgi:TRAP-type mannitol/chloroaromatic compound transport system substrate-binding protein|nr:TRAP transporter substrate-binding protein [Dongiaceae bacterium]
MKRRDFLAGAGLAGAGVATALSKPAIAQDKTEWKMVTSWPKGMAGLGSGAERLADRIGSLSGGRLTVKVFSAGELVPATQCLDAVSQGVADMAHDFAHYHLDKTAAAGFFASVPFGLAPDEFAGWINFGGGQELWDELYGQFGVKPFLVGNTGIQMGGWFRKEIKTPKDINGLKLAITGYPATVWEKLGGKAVNLPVGEIFGNLQSGAIDGANWIGPYTDLSLGLYKLTKNYYWPGAQEPGCGIECLVNRRKYDALPDDLKQIVAAACAAESAISQAEYSGRNPGALATLANEYKVQLKQYPKAVITALAVAAGKTMQEVFDKGDDGTRKVASSYLKFRKQAIAWTRISYDAFAGARDSKYDYPTG